MNIKSKAVPAAAHAASRHVVYARHVGRNGFNYILEHATFGILTLAFIGIELILIMYI